MKCPNWAQLVIFSPPVSHDSLVLQGLRCVSMGADVLSLVLLLSLCHTGQWKFNMAPMVRTLWGFINKIKITALHKDGVGYKKIAKTLKLSCSTVDKTIQRFYKQDRFHSEQASPWSAKEVEVHVLSDHIQRLCLGNRRMSADSIAAEVEGVWGSACQSSDHNASHCIK